MLKHKQGESCLRGGKGVVQFPDSHQSIHTPYIQHNRCKLEVRCRHGGQNGRKILMCGVFSAVRFVGSAGKIMTGVCTKGGT